MGGQYENSLLSSSLSELFSRKFTITNQQFPHGHSVGADDSHYVKEPFESLKELEAHAEARHTFSIPKDNPSEKDDSKISGFNLDSSVSNDELHQIFGVYGEIKEIRETPHRSHHKFIEFYDIRAAEAALRALNSLATGFSGALPHGGHASSMENGSILGRQSANGSAISSYLDNAFDCGISFSVPNSLLRVGPNGQPVELNEGGVCATRPQQLHAVPRAPSHMLNALVPINNHHVGSAPSVNPSLSLWDRRHAYAAESPDASSFHPGSLGSMRISGNSPHPLEYIPHAFYRALVAAV
ncbi:hypothetical protein HAX54_015107 [Datura stramonium]|uniref:RRM domain-containing protein n=1 Tax=Datura stramonium TaxID=4076 RepID=A0ABS8TP27_DATST|nr:hypothetical protein [Datura stramonium]